MVDVGLFTCGKAAVDLVYGFVIEVLKEDFSGSLIEHLFDCGSVGFILVLFFLDQLLGLHGGHLIDDFLHVNLGVQFGVLILSHFGRFAVRR